MKTADIDNPKELIKPANCNNPLKLTDINNDNTKLIEITGNTKVEIEKIIARTKKGKQRSLTLIGSYPNLGLIDLYGNLKKKSENEMIPLKLQIMRNRKGELLTLRELVRYIQEGIVDNNKAGFSSLQVLKRWKDSSYNITSQPFEYTKGIGTRSRVKRKKGISNLVVDIAKYYIDTPGLQIIEDIWETYNVKVDEIYWPDDEKKQEASMAHAEVYYTTLQRERTEKIVNLIVRVKNLKKDLDKEEGLTIKAIWDLVRSLVPGYQPERHREITKEIARQYRKQIKGIRKGMGNKKLPTLNQAVEGMRADGEDIEATGRELDKDKVGDKDKDKDIYVKVSDYSPYNTIPSSDPNNSHNDISSSDPDSNANPVFLDKEPSLCEVIAPESQPFHSYVIEEAARIFSLQYPLTCHAYNEAFAVNLLSYCPVDVIDERQLEVMHRDGFLPSEYQMCSPNSPRVYSKEIDNLFYCRKELRLQAMEGLGFVDMDIENCHAHIALGLWGEDLPLLSKFMEEGSLWTSYEEVFRKEGVKFYKSLIKAMHHATFLGGCEPAYRKALNRYNLKHQGSKIKEDEFECILKVFKKCPIYKELKTLFKKIGEDLHGKKVKLMTGETFNVKALRRYKDNSVPEGYRIEYGNVPTVIAAMLQAVEVTIMSYVICRAHEYFIPVLWQHDGFTIKALYKDSEEKIRVALTEISEALLDRGLNMTVTNL